ncbi:MAG TPA: ABC transporter permease [Natronosporangium sp.]
MRIVFPRAAAARTLLVAAAFAATVTTVLLTAFVLYAQLLPIAGVRSAMAEASVAERTLMVTASAPATPEQVAARDAAIREVLSRGLAGVPLLVSAGGYASGQELPAGLAPDDGSAVVAFMTDLPDHARLVDGAWPEPAAADDDPVQAALPVEVAEQLGVSVGDQVPITDNRTEPQPAPVEVVGLWEPVDPAEPYWRLISAPVELGGWGPFVVPAEDYGARYLQLGSLEWVADAEPDQLANAGMSEVAADYRALADELEERKENDPALDRYVRLSSGLEELAGRLGVATVVNRSGMVLPAALLVVIGGYGLVLVARLLAAHRRGENALLRARGASRRQLVWFTIGEAAMVVTPAALLGGPLGTRLVIYADRWAGDRSLNVEADLAPSGWLGPPLGWAVAVVTAIGCALALAVPAAGRGRTWVAEQQERSRPSRASTLQRAGVDLALVALAVLAWTQLRQYGSAVTVSDTEYGLGIDPLLVAAPVVGVLAATAVALRLLPLATRLGVRLTGQRDGFASLLGMWQADRRPHAGPVLLMLLAVATAVLAPAIATTWQQSQRDQAAQSVGADLRVGIAEPTRASGSELAAALPAATGLMPVSRGSVSLPEGARAPLLALDSEAAPEVARFRPDAATAPLTEVFGRLREGRPEFAGVPVPAGSTRLTGRLEYRAPETIEYEAEYEGTGGQIFTEVGEVPGPRTNRLTIYVMTHAGEIHPIRVGIDTTEADELGFQLSGGSARLDRSGGVDIDVPLPPDAAEVVGVGAGVVLGTGFFWGADTLDSDPIPVSWQWELAAVDAAGADTPLELPPDWQVTRSEFVGGPAPATEWDGSTLGMTIPTVLPIQGNLLVAPGLEVLSPVPVVATPDVLAAVGAEVGSTLTFAATTANELPEMQVVGTVDTLPGTERGSGVVADLRWLSIHQLLRHERTPEVTEWWVATDEPASAVAELGWAGPVLDRRAEAARLLSDPLGSGMLIALWAAAATAAVLAAFGLVVDSRATAVRRQRELAVLHTLGTSPPALVRALVVEHAMLAGLGVVAGLLVGVGVAAAMGPSLVLTPAGAVPVPEPLLALSPELLALPTAGLLAVSVVLGAAVARRARREVVAGALRIGED